MPAVDGDPWYVCEGVELFGLCGVVHGWNETGFFGKLDESIPEVAEFEFLDPGTGDRFRSFEADGFREDVMPSAGHASVLAVVLLRRWGQAVTLDGVDREIKGEVPALPMLGQVLDGWRVPDLHVGRVKLEFVGCVGEGHGWTFAWTLTV
ncbi:MAG: hypothetical protein DWQ49_12845 [Bacteroidetes bacterium]|nr:MAG: hypothetical protein DWQ49_12845 [Bacteroidota bacterium]